MQKFVIFPGVLLFFAHEIRRFGPMFTPCTFLILKFSACNLQKCCLGIVFCTPTRYLNPTNNMTVFNAHETTTGKRDGREAFPLLKIRLFTFYPSRTKSHSYISSWGQIFIFSKLPFILCRQNYFTGLKITASQRTMSGQNEGLTGQILGCPDFSDFVSGHVWFLAGLENYPRNIIPVSK